MRFLADSRRADDIGGRTRAKPQRLKPDFSGAFNGSTEVAPFPNSWSKGFQGWEPLGNHQFAATLFFQSHGLVEGGNGALGHLIGRWLRGDALEP